ncbi:MAG: P-II family nitrogen regulator [bacterium]
MHLLVLVLNKEELLDEVLEAFVEAGITGATIVDSVGMGRTLAYRIPLFAGLRKSIKTSDYNKMIFSVIHNDEILKDAVNILDKIIDFDKPGTGLLFVVPITLVKGIRFEELSW